MGTPRGDEHDDACPGIVPDPQAQPPFDGLHVIDARLTFNEEGLTVAFDHAVPRPRIALDRDGHLSTEAKR